MLSLYRRPYNYLVVIIIEVKDQPRSIWNIAYSSSVQDKAGAAQSVDKWSSTGKEARNAIE